MPNPLATDLDHVLAQTEGLWEDLRQARVFVTGGTGFFGSWLLETFLWANDRRKLDARVVVLTRDSAAFALKSPHLARHHALTLLSGDVRTFPFPKGTFTHVIHCATSSSAPVRERDLGMFETIVDGTRRTLEFACASGARRFLLTSSGAVYGVQPPNMTYVPEDHRGAPDPLAPRNVYGEGKRAAELLCALFSGGRLQPIIARCFAFIGPGLPLDAHFAAGNFIRDALNGGPIRVNGDGTPYRSYLYASDLAIWLWTLLVRGKSQHPYNVGSSTAISIAELAHAVAQAFDPPMAVTVNSSRASGHPPERYVPCTRRAECELGLRVTTPLDEAIRRTIRWHTLGRLPAECRP